MVDVSIHLYATLRQAAGVRSINLVMPKTSRVFDLLDQLCFQHPSLRGQLFDAQGEIYSHIHIFVNRRDITYLPDGLEAQLRDQDVVDLFPPVGGGQDRKEKTAD
jgi:MoaD family protein